MFEKVSEKDVSRAITVSFLRMFESVIESDVIVVGAGPAGLTAARELAKEGLNVLVIERNNYLGGGFWIGGFFMNKVTFRAPSQEYLREIGVRFEEASPGLYVTDGAQACSKLIAAASDAGVKFLQLTKFEDVVIREENGSARVAGVVVNWSPIEGLPRQITCVDPIALESKFVIDASGHDAFVVKALEQRGYIKVKGVGAMWVEASEDAIVEYTGEAFPGLIVAGMAVAETFGLPRMGPTFGAMLLSGKRAAEIIIEKLKTYVKV
ncbi:MAG: sulfide-dependent adenosine diphosphate thiazole synthase [Candidatus Hydrothermales bacterium]